MYVEEKDRSWCTSSASNDNRAITIEIASDTFEPYKVNDAAYKLLIKLLVDICKRNGIKKLVWSTNKSERMNHLNGCNMTVHRDYANKSCSGDYLYNLHGQIAKEVNAQFGSGTSSTTNKTLYRVRKTWNDAQSQKGAFYNLSNAKKCADRNKGYSVFDENGKAVYTSKSHEQHKLLQGADFNFRLKHPQRPRHKLRYNRQVHRRGSFHHCRNKARHRFSKRLGQAEKRCRVDCTRLCNKNLTEYPKSTYAR